MTSWERWLNRSGFRLVYQGGHHNVYCDGRLHLRTIGGTVGHPVDLSTRWPLFRCDCHKYVEPHPYNVKCDVGGCKLCRQKFLEEHVDTLPDAARSASRVK